MRRAGAEGRRRFTRGLAEAQQHIDAVRARVRADLVMERRPLRPDLAEFSKEDVDFNPIRNLPEFQALYTTTPTPA